MAFLSRRLSLIALLLLGCSQWIGAEKTVFYEPFTEDFSGRWIVSQSEVYQGPWKHAKGESTGDFGLLVSEKAKKYAIAAELPEPVDPKKDTLVLQYDLRLQNGLECGGAYLKFLMPQEAGWTPSQFKDDSPYSIMFGPDKCGTTNKVHFIFRHKDPKTGEYKEHHLKSPPAPITFDKTSHVYTAVIYPNNTLKVLVDGEVKTTADLMSSDFEPPVLAPKTIPDPEDVKPEDWDERAKIEDPEASKPDDWDESAPREIEDANAVKPEGWLDDEPLEVDDPEAEKPDDWDEVEDGEWEPTKVPNPKCSEGPGCGEWTRPTIANPAYKGKWKPAMIDNPAYKGIWKPRDIPNPDFVDLKKPNLETVAAVGIEIWTMSDGILFDNILVTDDEAAAAKYRETSWKPKSEVEKAAAKAKAKAEETETPKKAITDATLKDKMYAALYSIANLPSLAPYRTQLRSYILQAEDYPAATFSILISLACLFIAIVYSLIPAKKVKKKTRTVTMEQAKKEDISEADSAAPAATSEEIQPEAADEEKEKAAIADELDKEIEAEGEKVRRRTRRET